MKLLGIFFISIAIFSNLFSAQQKINSDKKALFDAVKSGNTERIKALLEKGVNPNIKTSPGQDTPLMDAIYHGKAKKRDIELLIKHGANVNSQNAFGKTALMEAARNNNLAIVKLLIANNANINTKNKSGHSALYWASFSDPNILPVKSLIKLLLINGADYKDKEIQELLKDQRFKDNIDVFNQAKTEIIQEYRDKINKYLNDLQGPLYAHFPKDLIPIIQQYLNFKNDEEILNNIIVIREALGEIPHAQAQQQLSHEQKAAAAGAVQ